MHDCILKADIIHQFNIPSSKLVYIFMQIKPVQKIRILYLRSNRSLLTIEKVSNGSKHKSSSYGIYPYLAGHRGMYNEMIYEYTMHFILKAQDTLKNKP